MPEIVNSPRRQIGRTTSGTGLSHSRQVAVDGSASGMLYLLIYLGLFAISSESRHAGEKPDSAVNVKSRKIQIPMSLRALRFPEFLGAPVSELL